MTNADEETNEQNDAAAGSSNNETSDKFFTNDDSVNEVVDEAIEATETIELDDKKDDEVDR